MMMHHVAAWAYGVLGAAALAVVLVPPLERLLAHRGSQEAVPAPEDEGER